jgi:hypothetical protein
VLFPVAPFSASIYGYTELHILFIIIHTSLLKSALSLTALSPAKSIRKSICKWQNASEYHQRELKSWLLESLPQVIYWFSVFNSCILPEKRKRRHLVLIASERGTDKT